MSAPLFDRIMQHALAKSFGLSLEPSLIPESEIKLEDADTRLKPMEVVFLNSALPHDFRSQWRNLFNSRYNVNKIRCQWNSSRILIRILVGNFSGK